MGIELLFDWVLGRAGGGDGVGKKGRGGNL